MTTAQILAIVAVLVVAAAIFVVLLRVDAGRVRRGQAEAVGKGEPLKKSPPLGLIYFGVGVAFVIVGLISIWGKF